MNKLKQLPIALIWGFGIGLFVVNLLIYGTMLRRITKQPEKIYVPQYDLIGGDIPDVTLWKIGDEEFYRTSSTVDRTWDGHIQFRFEFTSKEQFYPEQ